MPKTRGVWLVERFCSKYQKKFEVLYHLNSYSFISAARVVKGYTDNEIESALNFYFGNFDDNSFKYFCDNLDLIVEEEGKSASSKANLELLIDVTKRRLKDIEEYRGGADNKGVDH